MEEQDRNKNEERGEGERGEGLVSRGEKTRAAS